MFILKLNEPKCGKGMGTGLMMGEFLSLTWDNVNLKDQCALIAPHFCDKDSGSRRECKSSSGAFRTY